MRSIAPLELFGVVLRSKSNVMHRTGDDAARRGVGLIKQVNDSAGSRVVCRGKAKPILRFVNQTVAEADHFFLKFSKIEISEL